MFNVDEKVGFAAAALQLLGPNMVCQAKMDLAFKGLHRTKQWAAKRTLETPW